MPCPEHPLVAASLDLAMWSLRKVRARVVPAARGRVLELGCGTGLNFAHYPTDVSLTAIEPDPHMLRRAKRRLENLDGGATLLAASAEALPFDDATFDTVVATFVLCTIPDPARALAESRRVLAPGGQLLFAEHVRSAHGLMSACQDAATPMWRRVAGGCHLNRDALRLITEAGFTVLEHTLRASAFSAFPLVWGSAAR